MPLPQSHKNSLIFQSQLTQNTQKIPLLHSLNSRWIWSDRLVLTKNQADEQDTEFWNFTAFDLLMNEEKPIRFPKTDKKFENVNIFSLDKECGALIERANNVQRANFVKINWDSNEFQLIQYIEKNCEYSNILIDKSDPSKFIIQWNNYGGPYRYQVCKFLNGKIELGEICEHGNWICFYSKNRLIKTVDIKIKTYDIITEKEETFKINESKLPEDITWYSCVKELINDNICVIVEFKDTEKWGIACVDLITKLWKIVYFETNLFVRNIKFLNGNLMVNADDKSNNKEYLSEIEYHIIPIKRPNYLRYLAWICVVKVMKNSDEKDPYKAAKEYLPLNSDLREIWFKDEEK